MIPVTIDEETLCQVVTVMMAVMTKAARKPINL